MLFREMLKEQYFSEEEASEIVVAVPIGKNGLGVERFKGGEDFIAPYRQIASVFREVFGIYMHHRFSREYALKLTCKYVSPEIIERSMIYNKFEMIAQ